jgi:hypothetical protein
MLERGDEDIWVERTGSWRIWHSMELLGCVPFTYKSNQANHSWASLYRILVAWTKWHSCGFSPRLCFSPGCIITPSIKCGELAWRRTCYLLTDCDPWSWLVGRYHLTNDVHSFHYLPATLCIILAVERLGT